MNSGPASHVPSLATTARKSTSSGSRVSSTKEPSAPASRRIDVLHLVTSRKGRHQGPWQGSPVGAEHGAPHGEGAAQLDADRLRQFLLVGKHAHLLPHETRCGGDQVRVVFLLGNGPLETALRPGPEAPQEFRRSVAEGIRSRPQEDLGARDGFPALGRLLLLRAEADKVPLVFSRFLLGFLALLRPDHDASKGDHPHRAVFAAVRLRRGRRRSFRR
jgi:hypothetical protein